MKKYTNISELLIDFREYTNLSQTEFAALLDIDVRTVQRWEKNITLVKPEKEVELVEATYLPRQLVRNLNSTEPIPTYFDFKLRKYSLSDLDRGLPSFKDIKNRAVIEPERLHTIQLPEELEKILPYVNHQYHSDFHLNPAFLEQAIRLLPEINLFLADVSGYYAGHSLIFSLKQEAYAQIRNREMPLSDLKAEHLCNFRQEKKPHFLAYSVSADSNDGVYYLLSKIFDFFEKLPQKEHRYATFTSRYDSIEQNQEINLKLVWEESRYNEITKQEDTYRFYEGLI
jgi:transcriptional regulator with XRE-family HTH domain